MILNTKLERKPTDFETEPCSIEKVVELSESDFDAFLRTPLADYDFLDEFNAENHDYKNGARPCVLVLGEGHDDGICVDTSGYSYARYASYIPHARQIVEAEMTLENSENDIIGMSM